MVGNKKQKSNKKHNSEVELNMLYWFSQNLTTYKDKNVSGKQRENLLEWLYSQQLLH